MVLLLLGPPVYGGKTATQSFTFSLVHEASSAPGFSRPVRVANRKNPTN